MDHVEMTESFDQNKIKRRQMCWTSLLRAPHKKPTVTTDNNSKLHNVCSATFTRLCKGNYGDIPRLTITKETCWTKSKMMDPHIDETRFPLESISKLQEQVELYDDDLNKSPTHVLWRTYIKMVDILRRFAASHRGDNSE